MPGSEDSWGGSPGLLFARFLIDRPLFHILVDRRCRTGTLGGYARRNRDIVEHSSLGTGPFLSEVLQEARDGHADCVFVGGGPEPIAVVMRPIKSVWMR